MGTLSIWHWLLVLAIVLILFGGGNKISGLMGDFAKGLRAFKKNMADPEETVFEGSASSKSPSLGSASSQSSITNKEKQPPVN